MQNENKQIEKAETAPAYFTAPMASADTAAVHLDRLVSDGTISPDDKSMILSWWTGGRKLGFSMKDFGATIGYDGSTVSRFISGRYEGNVDKVLSAIRQYLHIQSERARMSSAEFVETSVWNNIRKTCDLALINQMPAMIVGISQIGKTSALLEYKRRSNFSVYYVRIPAAPTFRDVVDAVADSIGVTVRDKTDIVRRRVARALDNRSLLIVDELHQLAISSTQKTAMRSMEWLREIMDVSGCGMVVCGTRALTNDLIDGQLKGWLEQFSERMIKRLNIPDLLPASDIRLVARSFGLPEPDDKMLSVLRPLRMNRLVKIIQLGSRLANKRDEKLTWKHFEEAYNAVNR